MPEYNDNFRGALFKNTKKSNEKAPDYRGPFVFDGEEGEMAAWLRTSSKGTKYMSLKFTPGEERQQHREPPREERRPQQDFGDEPPF